MAMFAKDKPTKKIEFEGGFVELQFLSKGVKAEIASRLSSMFADIDEESLKKIDFEKRDQLPTSMIGVVGKINEVEYYKLSKAIVKWSAEVPVTEETVKDLDDELFDRISLEIDQMNQLNQKERKN